MRNLRSEITSPILSTMRRRTILTLFFISGFTALIYEVLWMKELALLFGNTAQAAATTFSAFFLGLAAGGYVWGCRAARIRNLLRTYALLELGVAVSALLYFLLLHTYHTLYATLFEFFGPNHALFLFVKFALANAVLFPPAFFMGGTLPIMSQYMVRRTGTLGRIAALLYAINTFGAAIGAFLAGFFLPHLLGFTHSYQIAITITGGVALIAWFLGSKTTPPESGVNKEQAVRPTSAHISPSLPVPAVLFFSFLSGFVTLCLEVLWTRMFAQVLQNSVYTFSTILVVFLVSLAAGGIVAHLLARTNANPTSVLLALLTLSALLVGISPFLFLWATDGLAEVGAHANWTGYVLRVFGSAAVVLLLPGIILGTVFPFLIKMSESYKLGAGRTVGDLVAVNTAGAVMGSLFGGFVLLDLLGLWGGIRLMAAVYFLAALVPARGLPWPKLLHRSIPVAGVLLIFSLFDPSRLPLVTIDPVRNRERIVEVWEGSAGTVAVIQRPRSLRMKVNNSYLIGGTGSRTITERQAHIPLLMHTHPRSVFFLGMGTGITAGATLQHPIERVVVTEIIPQIIEASRKHFGPYLHGLFEDARAIVVFEDGRNYLLGTREQFDVIISDLFIPWKAGTGSLYTREHYSAGHSRLKPGGIYAQWLPLYQISQEEFGIIARTMLEVFPLVTVWRGHFQPGNPTLLLAGHRDDVQLDPRALVLRLGERSDTRGSDLLFYLSDRDAMPADLNTFLLHYVGNLTAARHLLQKYPLNTDDSPLIEYLAPITHRRTLAKEATWFVGPELTKFFEQILQTIPPEQDPYLKQFTAHQAEFVRLGLTLHRSHSLR